MIDRPLLPFLGLQYGLCEIGPRRFDPRVLANRLSSLESTQQTLRRVAKQVYAVHDASTADTQSLLDDLTDLSSQIAADLKDATSTIASDLAKRLSVTITREEKGRTEILSSDVSVQEPSLFLESASNHQTRLIWISHEFDWLYPTDHRFWRFLGEASATGAAPLIIARKVAPATFVLCKAFGAKALQYYGLITRGHLSNDGKRRALMFRFPQILDPAILAAHRVWDHVELITEPTNQTAENPALLNALSRKFAAVDPTPSELLEWYAEYPELELPSEWIEGVKAWIDGPSATSADSQRPRARQRSRSAPTHADEGREEPIFGRKTEISRVPIPS